MIFPGERRARWVKAMLQQVLHEDAATWERYAVELGLPDGESALAAARELRQHFKHGGDWERTEFWMALLARF
jgi:hypothetical protein